VRGKLITASRGKPQPLGQYDWHKHAQLASSMARLVAFAPPRCCREGRNLQRVTRWPSVSCTTKRIHGAIANRAQRLFPLRPSTGTSIPGISFSISYSTLPDGGSNCNPTKARSVSRRSPTILRSGCGNFRTRVGMARIWSPAASCGCLTRSTTSILYRPARCCSQIFFRLAKAATDRGVCPATYKRSCHTSPVSGPAFSRDFFEALRSLRAAVR